MRTFNLTKEASMNDRYNTQDFGKSDPWPHLPTVFTATASIINDGKDISIILPKDFAGLRLLPQKDDKSDWNWLLYIGTGDDGNKVASGTAGNSYLRLSVASMREHFNMRPVAQSYWNCRRIGSRIFIGKLLENLSFKKSNTVTASQYDRHRPAHRQDIVIDDSDRYDDPEDTEEIIRKDMAEAQSPATDDTSLLGAVNPVPIHLQKKDTLKLSAFSDLKDVKMNQPSPTPIKPVASPAPQATTAPNSHTEMYKQALQLINNGVKAGMLEVRIREDGTIGASITTKIEL